MASDKNSILKYDLSSSLKNWISQQLNLFHSNQLLTYQNRLISFIINKLEIKNKKNQGLSKKTKNTILEKKPIEKRKNEKWEEKLKLLIQYRKENSDKWPQADSKLYEIRKIGIWCQDLRHRFRKSLLEEEWILKLQSINFNFNGREDNWIECYNKLSNFIVQNDSFPKLNSNLYRWAYKQYKSYKTLNKIQQNSLHLIQIDKYFKNDSWNDKFLEFKNYITKFNEKPTIKNNSKLFNWMNKQYINYKNKKITNDQIKQLLDIGVDVVNPKNKDDEWDNSLKQLNDFRELNDLKWPSYYGKDEEKRLYVWCQAQRQAYVGTAKRRLKLSESRVEKLNAIGFHWTLEELNEKNWEVNYKKLEEYLNQTDIFRIDKAKNANELKNLKLWLKKQRHLFKENKLSKSKIQNLKKLNLI